MFAPGSSSTQNRRVWSVTTGVVPRCTGTTALRMSTGFAAAENLGAEAPLASPVCVYRPESQGWPGSSW